MASKLCEVCGNIRSDIGNFVVLQGNVKIAQVNACGDCTSEAGRAYIEVSDSLRRYQMRSELIKREGEV